MGFDDLRSGLEDDGFEEEEDYPGDGNPFENNGFNGGSDDGTAIIKQGFTNAERAVVVLFGLFNLIALLAIVSIALGVFG